MTLLDLSGLPPPQRLAVAYTPPPARPPIAALLALDARLGRSLSSAHEPLLGQMRLAWWREELAKPLAARAVGDPVLAALAESWRGSEAALIAMADGWEQLLSEPPLGEDAVTAYAQAKGTAFAALASGVGAVSSEKAADRAGRRWALADLFFRLSDPIERARCQGLYDQLGPADGRLPKALRGVAVLDGLARRAMTRAEPLMAGRGGALAALRLGMLGR